MSKPKRKRRVPAVFTRKMSEKTTVLFAGLVLILFGLSVVLLRINETKGDEYTVQVLAQQNHSSRVLPFKRGDIVDRNGVTLATSVKVYNMILDPKLILEDEKFIEPTLKALNECFGYDTTELTQLINDNKNKSYLVYQKQLSYESIKAFLDISNDSEENPYVKGVTFESEYQRKYPFSTLASTLIGFTAAGNVGNWGIEEQYDQYLDGVDGREYGYVNSDNIMEKITKEAEDGDNVITTIDFNVQTIIEKYIAQWKEKYTPQGISVIIMNPQNGEILAMSGDISYDLNNPRDLAPFYTQEEIAAMSNEEMLNALNDIWRNPIISDTMELGSTFKPLTIAAGLEENVLNTSMTFLCDGGEDYGSYIPCHKRSGHGMINLAEAIAYSCNDALMQVGVIEGVDTFLSYQQRFGFGSKTGIDLPGESSAAGLLFTAENMKPINLATSTFGQGFNGTMIQLVSAFSSVINGGNYYEPHVVRQIVKNNGSIVNTVEPKVIKRTVTQTTSDYIKTGLRACVEIGTGKSAAVNGYIISGKTGTAQKRPISEGKNILSFIGFAPYDTPEVVCYVSVDDPVDELQSSVISGSLFSGIMTEILPYLNISPDGVVTEEPDVPAEPVPAEPVPAEPVTAEPGTTEPESQTSEQETTVSNVGEPEVPVHFEEETTAAP